MRGFLSYFSLCLLSNSLPEEQHRCLAQNCARKRRSYRGKVENELELFSDTKYMGFSRVLIHQPFFRTFLDFFSRCFCSKQHLNVTQLSIGYIVRFSQSEVVLHLNLLNLGGKDKESS